jgi:UDP-N-acetylglucosamine 4,6-dehydratase
LAAGRRITISDPDATRFWMTQDQAVDLVLSALREHVPGVRYIPDLPAYRLGDLAVALGAKEFDMTGLALHEKKHEEMSPGETSDRAPRLSIEQLKELLKDV